MLVQSKLALKMVGPSVVPVAEMGNTLAMIGGLGDASSLGGEMVAVEGGDSELLVEPLQMLLPSQSLEVGVGLGVHSSWVMEMIMSFRQLVGVSYEGHEAELMSLFVALEKKRGQSGGFVGRLGGKLMREFKALESSVNYDANVSCSRRSKSMGRAIVNV